MSRHFCGLRDTISSYVVFFVVAAREIIDARVGAVRDAVVFRVFVAVRDCMFCVELIIGSFALRVARLDTVRVFCGVAVRVRV